MYCFHNDYNEMCHPDVLRYLQSHISAQAQGYGQDAYCRRAAERICRLCGREDLAVHFLSGGTQTNLTLISAALRPHQAVLAAESGHIQVHETGAIEATGHKVLPLPSGDGKITAAQIEAAVLGHWDDATHEHMPQPGMVYLSQPTELGTLYTLSELTAISRVCRSHHLILYVDGARLGYGLTAEGNDVQLPDLAALTDAFYIGGTKVGAMFGEALVLCNGALQRDFRYIMKQRGGMLAKGWLLGLQFEALLADGLYWQISRHANALAEELRQTLEQLQISMPVKSKTNQVFALLPVALFRQLEKEFTVSVWEPARDGKILVRFCTSWATAQQGMEALIKTLRAFTK